MRRYIDLNDRPVPSGSMDPRLSPRIVERQLNAKLGPALPSPLVRETSTGAVNVGSNAARRRLAGLPERFNRD